MVVEMACTCDDLPPHSHISRPVMRDLGRGAHWVPEDTGDVRIWVDWKEVARALAADVPRTPKPDEGCWNCGGSGHGCCQATVMY